MDEESNEPVMWARKSSLDPVWTGSSATTGFQILVAVPRGRPSHTEPIPIKPEHLEDVPKFFPFIRASERAEWEGVIADPKFLLDPPEELDQLLNWFPDLEIPADAMEVEPVSVDDALPDEVHPAVARALAPQEPPQPINVQNHPITEITELQVGLLVAIRSPQGEEDEESEIEDRFWIVKVTEVVADENLFHFVRYQKQGQGKRPKWCLNAELEGSATPAAVICYRDSMITKKETLDLNSEKFIKKVLRLESQDVQLED